MVDITFGNLNQIDGKNVLTGGQSGIDTDGLIDSLAEARRLPAVALEESIETNLDQISALGTLESRLTALENSLNALRRPSGFGTSETDVFSSRLAFQTASDGSTATNYFGVVAQNGAAIRSYDVEVLNLAVAESRRSITFSSETDSIVNAAGDETSGFFSEGTFQINDVNVTLNEGDNLNNIVARINSRTDDTNVEASVLKVSETEFRLIISSTETGVDNGITITDATDSVFVGGDESDIFVTTVAAENASISIDGDVVSRQSNVFSDVVSGVTFSLFQETASLPDAPTVKVDIGKDTTAITEAIVTFVDAYNDLRLFYGEQTERNDDNELLDTAVLGNNLVLNTVADSLVRSISAVSGISNPFTFDDGTAVPTSLTDLGITIADFDGDDSQELSATTSILEVDVAKLADKIESNFDAVRDIFGFELSSSSSDLNVFDRGITTASEEYTIIIDESNFGAEAVLTHVDGNELATPLTGLTYTVGGVNNGFTEFDGSTEYLEFADVDFSTNDFSVEASASFDNFSSPNVILGGGNALDYVLNVPDDSTVSIRASNSGNIYTFSLPEPLDTNTFYDFQVSRDGDDVTVSIIGGEEPLVSTQTIIGTDTFEVGVIGGNNSPAAAAFDGKIRDVAITNDGVLEADFLLDRDFNDRSGNNNHATATGTPNQTRSTTSTATIEATGDFEGLNVFYTGSGNETSNFNDTLEGEKKDYTLEVDTVAGTAQVTHIRGQALIDAIDLNYEDRATGAAITTDADSILGEFTFLYFGEGSESIDISYSQGFADKMHEYLDGVNNGADGSSQGIIADEVNNISDSNDSIQESIDRIDVQVDFYVEQLLIRFSALEEAIAASSSILDLLEAQTNAANNN